MFEKGKSGNPSGRPKEDPELKSLARTYTTEAIERIVFWMRSDNAKASVSACGLLLDRGYGKATQPLSGHNDMAPINAKITVEYIGASPAPDKA